MEVQVRNFRLWQQTPGNATKVKAIVGVDLPEWGLTLRDLQVIHDERGWYVMGSSVSPPRSEAKVAYLTIGSKLERAICRAVLARRGLELQAA